MASKSKTVSFLQAAYGINSNTMECMISDTELVSALNVKLNDQNKIVTREGLYKCTVSGTDSNAAIKTIEYIPVDGVYKTFVVDSNYKLYCATGSEPNINLGSSIGTLDGEATLIPFHNYCVILDGGYIKYTQGSSVDLAYDDGEGINGYTYSNLSSTANNTVVLANTIIRCGAKILTQDWGTGTLPLTSVDVYLSKTGTLGNTVTSAVYNDSGSLLTTATTTFSNSDITTNPMSFRFNFPSGGLDLESNTNYYVAVCYSGTLTNYLSVHGNTVATGGDSYYYDTGWHNTSTKNTLIGVKPGIAPKAKFGAIKETRLFTSGSPDEPGRINFSNVNTCFDWSTSSTLLPTGKYSEEGAGYVSSIDEEANSYPIGALASYSRNLYIFGKEEQPYLAALTGTSPKDYKIELMYQKVYTSHKNCLAAGNDIYYCSKDNVNSVASAKNYADLQTKSISDKIKDKINLYYDEDSFAGYNSNDGQYLLKLTGYDNILVGHVTRPIINRNGTKTVVWTEYKFKNLTPSTFASFNSKFYVGCTDGHIYRLKNNTVNDNGTQPDVEIKTGIQLFYFGSKRFNRLSYGIVSDATATFDCNYYKDGSTSSFLEMKLTAGNTPIKDRINFSCNELQLYFDNFEYTSQLNFQNLLFVTTGMATT